MKSAVFERQQGRIEAALETVKATLVKFPKFPKLYMVQGQIYQSQKSHPVARAVSQECRVVDLGQSTRGIRREEYQGSSVAGACKDGESRI